MIGCIARWPQAWPPGDAANHSSPSSGHILSLICFISGCFRVRLSIDLGSIGFVDMVEEMFLQFYDR